MKVTESVWMIDGAFGTRENIFMAGVIFNVNMSLDSKQSICASPKSFEEFQV